jgi:uncharacterized protein (TIGR02118 family)
VIKLIYCIRRLPGVNEEEFHRYWREVHGPLAVQFLVMLGACRYVRDHLVSTPLNEMLQESKGHLEPFDGVAEVWWESMDKLLQAMDTEECLQAQDRLFADEEKFIDWSRSCSFFCTAEG